MVLKPQELTSILAKMLEDPIHAINNIDSKANELQNSDLVASVTLKDLDVEKKKYLKTIAQGVKFIASEFGVDLNTINTPTRTELEDQDIL